VRVAGNSIETARLLLLSGSPQFPDGEANSSGQVGRNCMRRAVGATGVTATPPCPATHDLGTRRMSERPEDGVVDAYGRARRAQPGRQ
jgi:choline dehydrogenase-like flavoprotein